MFTTFATFYCTQRCLPFQVGMPRLRRVKQGMSQGHRQWETKLGFKTPWTPYPIIFLLYQSRSCQCLSHINLSAPAFIIRCSACPWGLWVTSSALASCSPQLHKFSTGDLLTLFWDSEHHGTSVSRLGDCLINGRDFWCILFFFWLCSSGDHSSWHNGGSRGLDMSPSCVWCMTLGTLLHVDPIFPSTKQRSWEQSIWHLQILKCCACLLKSKQSD